MKIWRYAAKDLDNHSVALLNIYHRIYNTLVKGKTLICSERSYLSVANCVPLEKETLSLNSKMTQFQLVLQPSLKTVVKPFTTEEIFTTLRR